ncbi:MAG: hypothetical protein K0R64_1110 [Novosphingobium lindaniclasticum]|jgi:hypothetical protein|nr:hypothetical protein [Novosphingobium lindaniclasticum]
MRQEQPRIIAPPHRHLLAVIEDRLLHPIERPRRQHRLDMPPRQPQRRLPPLRESRIPPPEQIGRLPRQPHPRGRRPHVALLGQMMQEPNLPRRRPPRILAACAVLWLEPVGIVEGFVGPVKGRGRGRRRSARAIALALPDLFRRAPPTRSLRPESIRPESIRPESLQIARPAVIPPNAGIAASLPPTPRKALPRQPDIPRSRNPPPPGRRGIRRVRTIGHGSPPRIGAKAPTQWRRGEPDHLSHVGRCRKMNTD